jgi:acyl-CoA dehydrogenase
MEELKTEARSLGLWNLFLPHKTQWTDGLSNTDYAPLAEIMGRSRVASEACNCSAPDTGNMEILTTFGTTEQQPTSLVRSPKRAPRGAAARAPKPDQTGTFVPFD